MMVRLYNWFMPLKEKALRWICKKLFRNHIYHVIGNDGESMVVECFVCDRQEQI